MPSHNSMLSNVQTILHSTAVAAGTTTVTPSAGVDTQDCEGVQFTVAMGAIVAGAATSIEVHQSSDDGAVDTYTAITGTKVTIADDGDDKVYIVDVRRPRERYVKCIVNRATQNSTVNAIVAQRYGVSKVPISQHASVGGSEFHDAPAEGTA